jgi:hypothetical protein
VISSNHMQQVRCCRGSLFIALSISAAAFDQVAAEPGDAKQSSGEITGLRYPSEIRMEYSCSSESVGDVALARTSLRNGKFALNIQSKGKVLPRKLRIASRTPLPLPRSPVQIAADQFSYFTKGETVANGTPFSILFIELVTVKQAVENPVDGSGAPNMKLSMSARMHITKKDESIFGQEWIFQCTENGHATN